MRFLTLALICTVPATALAKGPMLSDAVYALHTPSDLLVPGEALDLVGWLDFDAACERIVADGTPVDEWCLENLEEQYASEWGPTPVRIHFYAADGETYGDSFDYVADAAFVAELHPTVESRTSTPIVTGTVQVPEDLPAGRYVARLEHVVVYDERMVQSALFANGLSVEATTRDEPTGSSVGQDATSSTGNAQDTTATRDDRVERPRGCRATPASAWWLPAALALIGLGTRQ